jgi:hypothetical protein
MSEKTGPQQIITRDSPENNTRRSGSKKLATPPTPPARTIGGGDGYRSTSILRAKSLFLSCPKVNIGGFERHQLDLKHSGVSSHSYQHFWCN